MKLRDNEAVLLLGTNLGDKIKMLSDCRGEIEKMAGNIVKVSPIYESEAWGYTSEFNFLNQAIIVQTNLSPQRLLKKNQEIERKLGRTTKKKSGYTDRPIDIDILFYSHQIIQEKGLIIPHLQISNRKFVLLPLNYLMPDYVHPVLNKSISDLLKSCNDNGNVWISV